MYVTWSLHYKSACWPSCGCILPSDCMWSGLFVTNQHADYLAACSAISWYVILSLQNKSVYWPSFCLVPPLGSMWSELFIANQHVDHLVALFCYQEVFAYMLSQQCWILIILSYSVGASFYFKAENVLVKHIALFVHREYAISSSDINLCTNVQMLEEVTASNTETGFWCTF